LTLISFYSYIRKAILGVEMSKIDTLEPDFKAQVVTLIEAVGAATGRKWVCTAGRRTMAEQTALWNQGRSTPGSIVTKAPAGSSAHNFGLAADISPMKLDGSDVDWNAPESLLKQMADLAVEMGLTAGFYFKSIHDPPHVESPSWKVAQGEWKAGRLHVA
jgi:peptidoglycan LD-endopeptidase CwlK